MASTAYVFLFFFEKNLKQKFVDHKHDENRIFKKFIVKKKPEDRNFWKEILKKHHKQSH